MMYSRALLSFLSVDRCSLSGVYVYYLFARNLGVFDGKQEVYRIERVCAYAESSACARVLTNSVSTADLST